MQPLTSALRSQLLLGPHRRPGQLISSPLSVAPLAKALHSPHPTLSADHTALTTLEQRVYAAQATLRSVPARLCHFGLRTPLVGFSAAATAFILRARVRAGAWDSMPELSKASDFALLASMARYAALSFEASRFDCWSVPYAQLSIAASQESARITFDAVQSLGHQPYDTMLTCIERHLDAALLARHFGLSTYRDHLGDAITAALATRVDDNVDTIADTTIALGTPHRRFALLGTAYEILADYELLMSNRAAAIDQSQNAQAAWKNAAAQQQRELDVAEAEVVDVHRLDPKGSGANMIGQQRTQQRKLLAHYQSNAKRAGLKHALALQLPDLP